MEKLKSRKLIVSLVTAIFVVFNDYFQWGVDVDSVTQLIALVAAYLVGQGVADLKKQV